MWDDLWHGRSGGRIALAVGPSHTRVEALRERIEFVLDEAPRPARWTEEWQSDLTDQLYGLAGHLEMGGDAFIALGVPRFLHGQSQGIVELFGARIEFQPDGNVYAWPLEPQPGSIDAIEASAIQSGIYWQAVEWIRYARQATGGCLPFRMPIMVGPLDTANYLLGTTVLLEWVYTEPDVVHRLLGKITDTLIQVIRALQSAAGGAIHSHQFYCMRGGFDLASEVRALVSRDIYEAFEAPYLRRIGQACGAYGIHACGTWERTIPSALADANLRAMNGHSKENDLPTLCRLAQGKVALSIDASINVHDRFLWPSREEFFRHLLQTVPQNQPFETCISEDELPLWLRLHREIRGAEYDLVPPPGVCTT